MVRLENPLILGSTNDDHSQSPLETTISVPFSCSSEPCNRSISGQSHSKKFIFLRMDLKKVEDGVQWKWFVHLGRLTALVQNGPDSISRVVVFVADDAGGGVVVQEHLGRLNISELEGVVGNRDDLPLSVLVDRILPGNGLLYTGVVVNAVTRKSVLDLVGVVSDRREVPVSIRVSRLLPGQKTIFGVVVQQATSLRVLDADRGLRDSHFRGHCCRLVGMMCGDVESESGNEQDFLYRKSTS
ncbi:MAG: hypothetical protein JOS17DRAFT_159134 [Linnemannia elongata]|nr:MAG: hypothetical protein JOS17DRAFT_159134 [Linnemannia elongata]